MGLAPFMLVEPEGETRLVFDSPHSGRAFPPEFKAKASPLELRRGEDAFVDEIISGATEFGAIVLLANYSRCYIDLNRAETDIDAELLAEPWAAALEPTEKSRLGLGLIRRYVTPGVEVNARKLIVAEVEQRIATIYRPYNAKLTEITERVRRARPSVLHVSWHSMKSVGNAMTPDAAGAQRPDFVVSDRRGTSALPATTGRIAESIRALGYSVALNDPYIGGTIIARVGDPSRGVESVQIEINRRLYLDERTVEKMAGFAAIRESILQLTRHLAL